MQRNLRHKKNLIFSLIVISLLALPVAYFSLNYSGFCFAEFRYLSDYEQQKVLFNQFNSRTEYKKLDRLEGSENYTVIPYQNFEEYLKLYPDCCSFIGKSKYDSRGQPFVFIEKILGYYGARSGRIVEYVRYSVDGEEKIFNTMNDGYYLNNCGGVQNY